MKKNNKNINNQGIPAEKERKDRQVDNLINIVENHTRTERHLEKYSNIGDPKYKENAKEKQDLREKQIHELKSQIIGDNKDTKNKYDQLEDIKENYQFSEGYIKSNKNHMSSEMLDNMNKKQDHRKTQIENLEENIENNKN